jgi:predicted dehydrogenase
MKKIKMGVFGLKRGRGMAEILLNFPEAELVAVCDKDVSLHNRVIEMAKEYNCKVKAYENFEDFFNHDMDAVFLANYANEHAPYAIRFLESGRHVLSEVLPCETMAQAVQLIEAVERTGNIYALAENYCYGDSTFEMWRRYKKGDIGEITYAEGEYIHDTSGQYGLTDGGDPRHWRSRGHRFFYCTHSLGPIITISGRRPVKVIGINTRPVYETYVKGLGLGMAGIEMVTLDNGAVVKSIHGGLKRHPASVNYEVYGTRGCMETQRFGEKNLNVYIEGMKVRQGILETYIPKKFIATDLAYKFSGHGGGDFYVLYFFLQRILDRPEGHEYSIDVYTAVDMGICGILANRSNQNGYTPIKVPNLRNVEERDAYRDDNACTTPEVAGDQLIPRYNDEIKLPEIPESVRKNIREQWLASKQK